MQLLLAAGEFWGKKMMFPPADIVWIKVFIIPCKPKKSHFLSGRCGLEFLKIELEGESSCQAFFFMKLVREENSYFACL